MYRQKLKTTEGPTLHFKTNKCLLKKLQISTNKCKQTIELLSVTTLYTPTLKQLIKLH